MSAPTSCPNCSMILPRSRTGTAEVPCPECGAIAPARGPSRRAKGELSRGERVEANRQIAQAMRFMRALRAIYGALATVAGLGLLFALLGSADASVVVPLGIAFATAIAGALNVERHPYPWSLALALTYTGLVAFFLIPGLGRSGVRHSLGGLIGGGIFVTACWTAFGLARRALRIAAKHPELRMARRLRGETIEDELGPVSTKYADQAIAERSARRRRRFAFIGGGIALLASVVYLAGRVATPDASPPGPTLPPPRYAVDFFVTKFRTAWNANRLDDVKAMFVPESRAKFSRGFDRIVANHGWTPLPTLPTPRIEPEGRYAAAYFAMTAEKGELYTSWAYDDPTQTWMINALRPPKD